MSKLEHLKKEWQAIMSYMGEKNTSNKNKCKY